MDQKYQDLIMCKSIDSHVEILDIFAEFLISAVKNHHQEDVFSHEEADAKTVLQMMLSKILYLKKNLEGICFSGKKVQLEKIIDPTIVGILVRNVYETAGLFSLIYRHSQSKEERQIKYLLWKHSGLSYRQRFDSHDQSTENKEKLQEERKEMEQIASMIKNNTLYQSLDRKNQGKIENRLKNREFLIQFRNQQVRFLHWHELPNEIGINGGLFENIYSYFSLYSHPSHVSVFQFKDMFNKEDRNFEWLAAFGVKYVFYMTSIFIVDYLAFFPHVKSTFDTLDKNHQDVIDFYNKLIRGPEYSIFI